MVASTLRPTQLRAIRSIRLERKKPLFAGSDGGADRWDGVASLIEAAKLNGVESRMPGRAMC